MAKQLTAKDLIKELDSFANRTKAIGVARYFKTGKGEYGEGDIFIGVTVPERRSITKKYTSLSMVEIKKLLSSKIHEYRSAALDVLCFQYEKQPERQKEIFDTYLANTKFINNWDLVDASAREIVGHYVWNHMNESKRKLFLSKLAKSNLIWERRIAIVSTYYGILKGQLDETYLISELLLKDTHDLMHKASGWMLREAGKKDQMSLRKFLDIHAAIMPRTMLRYALEKFNLKDRFTYMKMKALAQSVA